MKLQTIEDMGAPLGAIKERPSTWGPAQYYAAQGQPVTLPVSGTATSDKAYAEVNHGRWVVRCPFCASAQIASHTDPKFWCPECEMADVAGQWVEVVWPEDAEAIEELLVRRPAINRNWSHGETTQYLNRENEVHGVE
jgi:phage terminase large subunit GpA-like protein